MIPEKTRIIYEYEKKDAQEVLRKYDIPDKRDDPTLNRDLWLIYRMEFYRAILKERFFFLIQNLGPDLERIIELKDFCKRNKQGFINADLKFLRAAVSELPASAGRDILKQALYMNAIIVHSSASLETFFNFAKELNPILNRDARLFLLGGKMDSRIFTGEFLPYLANLPNINDIRLNILQEIQRPLFSILRSVSAPADRLVFYVRSTR